MKRFLLAAALMTAGLVACGDNRAATIAGLTGSATTGKNVYTTNCASCHGTDAKGGPTRLADGGVGTTYPSVVEHVPEHSATDFISILLNGVPGTSMVSFSSLTDQQLADLYAYLKTL